jgi:hypothetical protein
MPRPNSQQLQAYRVAAWLIQRHGVTVLPSVSSLRTLRMIGKGGLRRSRLWATGARTVGSRDNVGAAVAFTFEQCAVRCLPVADGPVSARGRA